MSRSKPPNDLSVDDLRLALSIAEGPSLKVSGTKLLGAGSYRFRRLRDVGLLVRSSRASTIICQQCDRRHRVRVDFDSTLRAMTYFCSEAGRVTVEEEVLNVYELDLDCLLDWIFGALRFTGKQRPITWIEGHLWELGEANIHHQRLRIMFARRLGEPHHSPGLESILARRIGTTGLILAASPSYVEPRRLSGFSLVYVEQVLEVDQPIAAIDVGRLLSIAEPEALIDPFSSGLPVKRSGAHLVMAEHERRITEKIACAKIGDEAHALEHWYNTKHAGGPPLSAGTIENRIRERHNQYKASLRSTI